MRVVAVASSDSHLKWLSHLAAGAPPEWSFENYVLGGTVSARQVAAATEGTGIGAPTTVGIRAFAAVLQRTAPDVVVLACDGPTLVALHYGAIRQAPPMVTVAATPGIALPARARAAEARAGIDVFIVHSLTEQAAYRSLFDARGASTRVALAHLPSCRAQPRDADADELVFATQAAVPRSPAERAWLLERLAASSAPQIVVHERTIGSETTAHAEDHPYRPLWNGLVSAGRFDAGRLSFRHGPMSASLTRASGLVTVSSTAALEAVAADVPIGIVADFGVDDAHLNRVFESSGCLVRLADGSFTDPKMPHAAWRRSNYFHPAELDDWAAVIADTAPTPGSARPGPSRRAWWPATKAAVRRSARAAHVLDEPGGSHVINTS